MRPDGDAPRVTVIIATFNRARMLRCALQSVLRQQVSEIEVLVVGDSCTDDSERTVSEIGDPRVRWLNRQTNCGSQWAPNNDGIALARSAYVAFLGHDDLWFPWHLATLIPLLDAGADLGHSIVASMAPEGARGASAGPPKGASYDSMFIAPSGWLVRRKVLEDVGGFRDQATLSRGTDEDLLRRIARAGSTIQLAPRLTVLKFPSHWWGAYAPAASVPQEEWLAAMVNDPAAIERSVLTRVVMALTNASLDWDLLGAIKQAGRLTARKLFRAPARDHGFIHSLLRMRFQSKRKALRRKRGL